MINELFTTATNSIATPTKFPWKQKGLRRNGWLKWISFVELDGWRGEGGPGTGCAISKEVGEFFLSPPNQLFSLINRSAVSLHICVQRKDMQSEGDG